MTPACALGCFAAASVVAVALGVAAAAAVHRWGERVLDRLGVPREVERAACPWCGAGHWQRTTWERGGVRA